MCSIGLAISGVGAVMSARGAAQQARGQRAAAEYNAQVGEMQAQDALARGRHQVARQRGEIQSLKSDQIATMAASGVDIGYGSALDVLAGTDVQAEAERIAILDNAQREAFGHRTGAAMDRFRASQISPGRAAATSLLGSATTVASNWYTLRDVGKFGGGGPGGGVGGGGALRPATTRTSYAPSASSIYSAF